jgi:hypothetical protein|tara:strand:- start:1180 stop:1416 length:237 start_codon:yes stop_codon:yes gene_type:complete
MSDWIDDILEDELCSMWQIGFIEQLMQTSAITREYDNINFDNLTYNEAEKIIQNLRENDWPRDPKDQYQEMFKRGVFE